MRYRIDSIIPGGTLEHFAVALVLTQLLMLMLMHADADADANADADADPNADADADPNADADADRNAGPNADPAKSGLLSQAELVSEGHARLRHCRDDAAKPWTQSSAGGRSPQLTPSPSVLVPRQKRYFVRYCPFQRQYPSFPSCSSCKSSEAACCKMRHAAVLFSTQTFKLLRSRFEALSILAFLHREKSAEGHRY
eukprot:6175603-Pleurochrysis_carterae.AAC.1